MRDQKCFHCGKKPEEIEEYVEAAREEETSPAEYVSKEEGTYDPVTGCFYCTLCYVEVGMPLRNSCLARFRLAADGQLGG